MPGHYGGNTMGSARKKKKENGSNGMNGLTAKQKSLPKNLQMLILKKKKKNGS